MNVMFDRREAEEKLDELFFFIHHDARIKSFPSYSSHSLELASEAEQNQIGFYF